MPRIPGADSTNNRLSHEVTGNKADAAVTASSSTASLLAYAKGNCIGEATGTADIDISAAVYTGYVALLTITPAAGCPISDLTIDLDLNKETTGWDTIATASDTIDIAVVGKIDGTNYRKLIAGTQVTAAGDGSLTAAGNGQRLSVGLVTPSEVIQVQVKLSAERDDCEIPYRVMWRGPTPTITPVAAG